MPDPLLEFDAAASNSDGTDPGSPLSIWNTASYVVTAFSPDAAGQTVQWATSVDTEGSLPASFKDENRTINITVECLSAAALRALQAKVTKVSRERGTLKYTLPNSEIVIFDLLARASFSPEFDIAYFINSGAYCSVQMSFIALPSGRGTTVTATLSAATASANRPHIFTVTGVKCDMPATGHLTITNATNAKSVLYWGIQSRQYSAAATAALFFEAEDCTIGGSAAANAGPAGASGGGASKVVRAAAIGTSGTLLATVTASSVSPTHVGQFRVFARVQVSAANTGTVSVRGTWVPANDQVYLDWVPVEDSIATPIEGSWVILDLGLMTSAKARLGTQWWTVQIQAKSTVGADQIDLDWIAFIPTDEGYGRTEAYTGGGYLAADTIDVGSDAVLHGQTILARYRDTRHEGDFLHIPPAGAEARTLRVIALLTGDGGTNLTSTLADAVNLDATTATLTYTPRYLVVPEP